MPTVAVVIPAKNEERYLPGLLEALRRQTVRPDDVAVGDGGSSDATRDIARKFGAKVVQGGSTALGRNKGAAVTTSDLIVFFDADAIIEDPRFIERAMREFTERGLDVATADVDVRGGTLVDRASFGFYNRYVRWWGARHPHPIGTFIMVRRSVHEALRGFDTAVTFAEDHDYGLRARDLGYRFGVLDTVRIGTSPRRQERIGRVRFLLVNALAEPYIMLFGSIKKREFKDEYEKPAS
ncbi:glycosyltransferase [Candidatus Uhrbacteria bacterium]|nr:glycosyltransferase [Candidatus Uhrbacteria bacterium]